MPAAWQSENRRTLPGPGRAHGGAGWGWPCPLCRLQMAEAALALSEQKAQELGERLATAEQEHRSLTQKQAKEHRLEQQVGRRWAGGLAGGVWQLVTSGALPTLALRKLRSASPSCSETCLLPLRRTCSCRTRCGVWGTGPGPPRSPGWVRARPQLPWCWLPGGRAGAEGAVTAGPAAADQAGADQQVG